eukprot:COSAG01_NODE_395_length_17610_cov_20.238764_6_plen_114_part_00
MLCYLRAQDVDMDAGRALNRLVNTAAWRLKLELDESVNALGVEQRLESHEVTPITAWPGVLAAAWLAQVVADCGIVAPLLLAPCLVCGVGGWIVLSTTNHRQPSELLVVCQSV